MLPLLETYAIHTPVTFTVQEHYIPTYDPKTVFSSYYTTECADGKVCNIDIRSSGHTVSDILLRAGRYQSEWYKNGVRTRYVSKYNSGLTNEQGLIMIAYNNTEDIQGIYIGLSRTNIILNGPFRSECPAYHYYIQELGLFCQFLREFIIEVSYWKIMVSFIFSIFCNL